MSEPNPTSANLTHAEQVQRMYDLTYELLDTAETYRAAIKKALQDQLATVEDEEGRQKLTSLIDEWLGPEIERFIHLIQDDAITILHRIYETDGLLDKSNLFTEVML